MTDEEDSRIEVKVKPGADKRAVDLSNKLDSMLNSPLFERMVLQVVEKMIEDGTQVEIGNNYISDDWYCIFGGIENLADADVLPLAICLAAKKTIEGDRRNGQN